MRSLRYHEFRRGLNAFRRGENALVHRIGEGDSFSLDQLPDPARLPPFVTIGDFQDDPRRAGMALAESFFKLLRPGPGECGPEVDGSGGWLHDYLSRMDNREMRLGFLCHVEELLQLALMYAERLPAFVERLDALDNASLQEQATKALCFEEVRPDARAGAAVFGDDGGLFAGLTGSEWGQA